MVASGSLVDGRRRHKHKHKHKSSPSVPSNMAAYAGVAHGALFGGTLPLTGVANRLHRKLTVVRRYYFLGQRYPQRVDQHVLASGTTEVVSLDTNRHLGTYASIIAGRHDKAIRSFLEDMNQAAIRYKLAAIYVTFQHEANNPSGNRGLGSAAEFVKAWDHAHAIATRAHLDWNQGGRLHWVLILSHWVYTPMKGRGSWVRTDGQIKNFWPGKNEVDVVAADGYSGTGCGRGKTYTPAFVFNPMLSFARSVGRPAFITEWASAYSSRSNQSEYIREMTAYLASNRVIAGTMYWDGPRSKRNAGQKRCDSYVYAIDGHPQSMSAMTVLAHSPAMQGHIVHVLIRRPH